MRVFYLPQSSVALSHRTLLESMRRWHWHQYFLALRKRDQVKALHHRRLAESIQYKR